MLTDYQILHIPKNADIQAIKSAYRKIVKEIHPDVTNASFEKHLLFVQINQARERLMKSYKADAVRSVKTMKHPIPKKSGIIKHKDPAYAFYKTGMKCFMKIHPSQWQIKVKTIMDTPGPKDTEELEKVKAKVKNLVKLFHKAYYYFSIVVHKYLESVWFKDAKDKMTLIEERTIRYKKIIESFTEHAKSVPIVNKIFFKRRG